MASCTKQQMKTTPPVLTMDTAQSLDTKQQPPDPPNNPSPSLGQTNPPSAKSLSGAGSESAGQSPQKGGVMGRQMSVPEMLYRRPLPESCIAFASCEGKAIFKEALGTGHLNCYFRLASQFRTQDEPAYCGLATLIMVLNALEIDPGRVWKGPWKWYHEDMLDCCVSTEMVRKEGITFDEFICLADCNYLDTKAVRVDASCKEDDFRTLVKDITLKEDSFLVLSYSRAALGQTGDGHFAPVSGYHPGRDLVLILDTARFKYPPHWIPLSLLFKSMTHLDESTGLPRGYILLWSAQDSKALLLFKTSEQFSVNASPPVLENYEQFLSAWNQVLARTLSCEDPDVLGAVVRQALQGLVKIASTVHLDTFVLRTQEHIRCNGFCSLGCVIQQLLAELESTQVFKTACDQVLNMSQDDVQQLQNLFGVWSQIGTNSTLSQNLKDDKKSGCRDLIQCLCLCHFVAVFLLSWPYSTVQAGPTLGGELQALVQADLGGPEGQLLVEEMTTLHKQLKKLVGYHTPLVPSPDPCCPTPGAEGSNCQVNNSASVSSRKVCCSGGSHSDTK